MDILQRMAIPRITQPDTYFQLSEQCVSLFDTARVGQPESFSRGSVCCLVDTLTFTRAHFDPILFRHRESHPIHREADSITLQFRSGSTPDPLGGAENLTDPACTGVSETLEQYRVIIPSEKLAQHGRSHWDRQMISWAMDSPEGGLLMNTVAVIWRELPRATQAGASALALAFVGLLNGLLAAEPDLVESKPEESTIAISIQNYLRANLQRTDVDVKDLCHQFHCSRATLYRMFREHGGVKTYVRDLRLERCLRDLTQLPERSRGRIRKVAEQWGFYDPSHFYRLFKQRFGISPSDVPLSSSTPESTTAHISHRPAATADLPVSSENAWFLNILSTLPAPNNRTCDSPVRVTSPATEKRHQGDASNFGERVDAAS